jgi:hypothetical protein
MLNDLQGIHRHVIFNKSTHNKIKLHHSQQYNKY